MEDNLPGSGEPVFDLTDVVEEGVPEDMAFLPRGMVEHLTATVERVARELFPAVAERVVREEIEKLKENRE
ncbi:MAG TPA: hypothetical protein PKL99_07480 [Syntrophales bacterium]|nr:hypothetical protein [Syntrophales bacterium]